MSQPTAPILCDSCLADISYTGNSIDYRILVCSQHVHSREGMAVTDAMIYDPLPNNLHFCGLGCLRRWAKS